MLGKPFQRFGLLAFGAVGTSAGLWPALGILIVCGWCAFEGLGMRQECRLLLVQGGLGIPVLGLGSVSEGRSVLPL